MKNIVLYVLLVFTTSAFADAPVIGTWDSNKSEIADYAYNFSLAQDKGIPGGTTDELEDLQGFASKDFAIGSIEQFGSTIEIALRQFDCQNDSPKADSDFTCIAKIAYCFTNSEVPPSLDTLTISSRHDLTIKDVNLSRGLPDFACEQY